MAAHHTGSRPAGTLTSRSGSDPASSTGTSLARPAALCARCPPFSGDALDPAYCGGDLCVQACSSRGAGRGGSRRRRSRRAVKPRWTQTGHLRRDPRDPPRGRPRDPLGFKDGTHNPRRGRDLDRHVWAGPDERTWMAGGTYLVMRRIEIDGDAWGRLPVRTRSA